MGPAGKRGGVDENGVIRMKSLAAVGVVDCRSSAAGKAGYRSPRSSAGESRLVETALSRIGAWTAACVAARQSQRPRFVELPAPAWPTTSGIQISLPGGAIVTLPPQAAAELVTTAGRAEMVRRRRRGDRPAC